MGLISKLLQGIFGSNKESKTTNDGQGSVSTEYNKSIEPYDEYMTYKNSSEYPDDFVVFDFETTGLDAKADRIIQIGALRYRNNEKVDEFITYVNPQKPIQSNITDLTGITSSDVKNAPTISQIFPRFTEFIGDYKLIAHNADFDIKFFLNNAYNLRVEKPKNEVIDTLALARKYIKDEKGLKLENYKLPTLKKFLGITVGSHNSADDCIVCAEVYKKCKEKIVATTKPKKNENTEVDNKFKEIEQQCYENIKQILLRNNRPIKFLKPGHTGNYFDILTFYTLVRIKLQGKKQYILTKHSEYEVKVLWPDSICEAATKSETGVTRIAYNSPEDLFKIEPLIVKDFDDLMKSLEYYREGVSSAERHIKEYLSS
ncbi:3'-5' exonuclease [Clostridium sp. C8-1-8]|uniref:3'-5' exonuclease n=1 Tax=Clostridium sp. C8-1-8 TaxID=2698831 RepID=UPI00136C907D|nr:3'-5' exonuclease [Clostridium sp. C8-1-8]